MTDSMHIHQHLGKQDGNSKENPPRAHVERTRDVFKESKPAAEDEDTHKESKMQSRRAEQPVVRTKSHKRKSAEAKEKEELSTDEQRSKDLAEHEVNITYSNYYYDDDYEYRHVTLPKEIAQWLPHYGLLSEDEWRSLGVRQSLGWEHYMVHNPEPHVLLFKREKDYQKKHPPKKSKQSEAHHASNDEEDTENKEAYNKKPRRV